jgi:precorrin-6Y C5,15-methyltransferase (decarboxylating)
VFSIYVIGIAEATLSSRQLALINRCQRVFGSERFKPLLAPQGMTLEPITPLSQALDAIGIALKNGNVALLASGDPLFFGIGRRLLNTFSPQRLKFFPALSSIQGAAALFGLPWDSGAVISLHGRQAVHLPTLLLKPARGTTFVFTDHYHSPNCIASQLLDYLTSIGDTKLHSSIEVLVAADIGLQSQQLFRGSLVDCSKKTFSPLNVLALKIPQREYPQFGLGLGEEDLHHSRGLITKNEIRAVTLHQLRLPRSGVFWDIGAGSGSISIEAARCNPELTVFSIERNRDQLENINKNIRAYGCYNVVPVAGEAPGILEGLAKPQAIFVGGSGGKLAEIIKAAATELKENGRLVVNGVIEKTIEQTPQIMATNNFICSHSTVAVSRTPHDQESIKHNPITIFTGSRKPTSPPASHE